MRAGRLCLGALVAFCIAPCQARSEQVPDLRGLGVAEARRVAEQTGLQVRVVGGDPAPSASLEYAVQGQEPPPGADLAPGGLVTLRIYAPQLEVAVPAVVGLQPAEARRRLQAAGLIAEVVGGDPAPEEARAFTVQSQDPGAGQAAARGGPVRVRVYGAAGQRSRGTTPGPGVHGPQPAPIPAPTAAPGQMRSPAAAAAEAMAADPYIFDVLRPGSTVEAVRSGLEQPLSSHRNPEGDLVEVFRARPRGVARATVWYDAAGVVRWARVQLVNALPAYAAALLFDLQEEAEVRAGHPFAAGGEPMGETHSYPLAGVHLFVHGGVVREIWLTLPREDLEDVAELVGDGLV